MFLSYLKIKPNTSRPAEANALPRENRADEKQAGRHEGNARQNHTGNTRGAIGTLAAIALLMWFISFFLLAGPGIGVSETTGARPEPSAKVIASTP